MGAGESLDGSGQSGAAMRGVNYAIVMLAAGWIGLASPGAEAGQSAPCVCPADAVCNCPDQPVGGAADSAAFGLAAHFRSGGVATKLHRIAFVQGSAPPAYSKSAVVASVNKTVAIAADTFPTPTLFVNATNIRSHVESQGIAVDSISSTGSAKLKSLNLALNLNPLPPLAGPNVPVPQPFLAVAATGIASNASFGLVFPSLTGASGSASFGSLTISGSLVGDKTLTFSGPAPKDTVLFQSPTVTITLDQQVEEGVVTCVPDPCRLNPSNITTDAIDIELHKADLDGRIVSGHIIVGRLRAGTGSPAPTPLAATAQ